MITLYTPLNTAVLFSIISVAVSLLWAAFNDVRRYIIPNAASLVIVLAFATTAVSLPINFALGGAAVAALMLIVGAILFSAGRIGGGDAKLLASVSLWSGPALFAPFTIVVCLSAFALSALMLSPFRTLLPAPPASATTMTGSNIGPRRPIPFGVAIAAGGLYLLGQRFVGG